MKACQLTKCYFSNLKVVLASISEWLYILKQIFVSLQDFFFRDYDLLSIKSLSVTNFTYI